MELNYNVTGADRKRLVTAISGLLKLPAKYMGAPSFAYEVGSIRIDKDGTVSFDDQSDSVSAEQLTAELALQGFTADEPESTDSLVIELPLEGVAEEVLTNLHKLVESKADLIEKALGADSLPIEITETTLRFPWFQGFPDGNEVSAYAHFVGKLVGMAKSQNRITAQPKAVENEKYAFRCFLLRLGFIGSEYKEQRKILLRNLSGNSAFKGGADDE